MKLHRVSLPPSGWHGVFLFQNVNGEDFCMQSARPDGREAQHTGMGKAFLLLFLNQKQNQSKETHCCFFRSFSSS
jgi:hypothetical protein